jgi:hypothetical protein
MYKLIILFAVIICCSCSASNKKDVKPRILISTDIGGTDPDDNQSMIHLLMYADLFQIEGLISSPYGEGRKETILKMIDLYEEDFNQLKKHSAEFPEPVLLRNVCKQGETLGAPFKGYRKATEGSEWIVKCARKESEKPLWILVWGGLEDLAQALQDEPGIKENIKVYWIGGPNKKWSVNAYNYIAENHPDLWMIEANATYRGWFLDSDSPEKLNNESFYPNFIKDRGALGKAFKKFLDGEIKMGDTPSLVYVMNGNPYDPLSESWGGSFTPLARSSKYIFTGNTSLLDTVVAYATIEWHFKGPEIAIPDDSVCFTMEISGQFWPGYYLGDGTYGVRYSSKKPEICTYKTFSSIPQLNGQTGQFVSITPWPGKSNSDDLKLGNNWYTDRQEQELFIGVQQGAKTVAKHREEFLMDWAKRWELLAEE